MKKLLLVTIGVATMAAPAFASKARLQALGEDIYGSTYIADNRNVFINAANVNNYNNFVTYEWGSPTTASGNDTNGTPKADGGVFVAHNNLVYGVYLGDETNDSHIMRRAGGMTAANSKEENNIGLFVGGNNGFKWGGALVYSDSKNSEAAATDQSEQTAMRARLGAILNNGLEIFSTINLANKAETEDGSQEFKGKLGYRIGAIMPMNDWRLSAIYNEIKGENAVTDNEQELQIIDVAAGRTEKLNDSFSLFTKVAFNMTKTSNDDKTGKLMSDAAGATACSSTIGAGGAAASVLECEEYKRNSIPVTIGMEYAATSWLALRGSVSQAIWSQEKDAEDKRTARSTTVVNAGASLLFGDMSIDGVIGNNATGTAAPGNNTGSGAGTIRTDSLLSRVAMTYKF